MDDYSIFIDAVIENKDLINKSCKQKFSQILEDLKMIEKSQNDRIHLEKLIKENPLLRESIITEFQRFYNKDVNDENSIQRFEGKTHIFLDKLSNHDLNTILDNVSQSLIFSKIFDYSQQHLIELPEKEVDTNGENLIDYFDQPKFIMPTHLNYRYRQVHNRIELLKELDKYAFENSKKIDTNMQIENFGKPEMRKFKLQMRDMLQEQTPHVFDEDMKGLKKSGVDFKDQSETRRQLEEKLEALEQAEEEERIENELQRELADKERNKVYIDYLSFIQTNNANGGRKTKNNDGTVIVE